jgi:hypothetical protein
MFPTHKMLFRFRRGPNLEVSVVEFLLTKSVNLAAQAGGQTGSHWAVIGEHRYTVKLLVTGRWVCNPTI